MPDAAKPTQIHRQNSNREHCPNAFAPLYLLEFFDFLILRNRTVVRENVTEFSLIVLFAKLTSHGFLSFGRAVIVFWSWIAMLWS